MPVQPGLILIARYAQLAPPNWDYNTTYYCYISMGKHAEKLAKYGDLNCGSRSPSLEPDFLALVATAVLV